MADFKVIELLPPTVITTGFAQSKNEAIDLGPYTSVLVEYDVLAAGSGTGGEALVLKHCAIQFGNYQVVSGAGIPVDSTATSTTKAPASVSRFVLLESSGTVVGDPAVGVRLVARG